MAQSDPPSPTPTSTPAEGNRGRAAFVCANLAQIEKVQADHATLLTDRLALLASAKQAAKDAGKTHAVARIDKRTSRLTERKDKVATRQQKLADYAEQRCGS